jgi:hypothetical protein
MFHSAGAATLNVSVSDVPEPGTFGLAAVFLSLTVLCLGKSRIHKRFGRGAPSATNLSRLSEGF